MVCDWIETMYFYFGFLGQPSLIRHHARRGTKAHTAVSMNGCDAELLAAMVAAQRDDCAGLASRRQFEMCRDGRGAHELASHSLRPCRLRTQNHCDPFPLKCLRTVEQRSFEIVTANCPFGGLSAPTANETMSRFADMPLDRARRAK
jgi:hypothetical protein